MIISNEAYIYVREGVEYVPLERWNRQAAQWAREVNRELQHAHGTLEAFQFFFGHDTT